MHRTSAFVTAFVLVCLCVANAPAAGQAAGQTTPRLVRFTGVVAGSSGAADITFALYADQASETPLWSETQHVVLGEGGRYAVYLGAGRPEGLPVEFFASGEAKWLGVRAAGQAEQPRVLLVSVPYALKAADAETIGGKPLSAFLLAGEKTGTASDGLTYLNPQALTTATKPLASGAGPLPEGDGSAGYIGVFTDAVSLGNSVIFQSGSSIGVGTTTPAAPFHVAGSSAPAAYFDVYSNQLWALPAVYRAARGTPGAPSAVQTDDILGGLAVRGYGATGFTAGRGQVMFKAAENWTDSANGTYLQFTTTPTGTANWAERMRITPAGNVGIGTTTPAQMLSVAGIIESTTGGIKFPDGTTQTSAAGSAGGPIFNTLVGAGALAANTTGWYNTASGYHALAANTDGSSNTASGYQALAANTTGWENTATGDSALVSNTTGDYNTADGGSALYFNTTGHDNTATGLAALYSNTTGSSNTASGSFALHSNTTGWFNTASGSEALYSNTTGNYNTASGYLALTFNTTGAANTASGDSALYSNTTGWFNTASGDSALYSNTTGAENTASGDTALYSNTTGNYNTALGPGAGYYLTTGSYNIHIGHPGFAAEGNTIRIGTPGIQTRTFIAGIRGVGTGTADAVPVVVDTNGQLGTVSSSRRVKDDIANMAAASSGLLKLRPVTFHYKSDQNPAGRTLQYGLIAEEVAEVYPGLVAHSADGQVETVLYQFLPPMLLNEYQKQQRAIDALRAQVETDAAQMQTRDEQIRNLTEQVAFLTRAVAALRDRTR